MLLVLPTGMVRHVHGYVVARVGSHDSHREHHSGYAIIGIVFELFRRVDPGCMGKYDAFSSMGSALRSRVEPNSPSRTAIRRHWPVSIGTAVVLKLGEPIVR